LRIAGTPNPKLAAANFFQRIHAGDDLKKNMKRWLESASTGGRGIVSASH
jgi:hypothetical protein